MAYTMKIQFLLAILLLPVLIQEARASAQKDVEAFYRPVKSKDLVTKLPPRLDKSFDRDSAAFTSETDGCPEKILIGSIDENADIFGDVNIDVYIGDEVFIDCGRF